MKKLFVLVLLFVASCNQQRTDSGMGMFYVEVTEPIAFTNGVSSNKTGEACQESFFSLVSVGNSSIEEAKKNGNITKVASINVYKKNVLVYGRACTIVKGE